MAAVAGARMRSSSVGLPRRGIHAYEERYPEMCKKSERIRFEERLKTLGNLVEEISEVDEEPAEVSDCSTSSLSLEGRSPYVLPVEDRIWHNMPRYQNSLIAQQLVCSNTVRRSVNGRGRLQRGFSEPILRQKRLQFSHGERRSTGSFDPFTVDLLNLPPIPETVPLQICSEKAPKFEEDGTDYDDSSECLVFSSSS